VAIDPAAAAMNGRRFPPPWSVEASAFELVRLSRTNTAVGREAAFLIRTSFLSMTKVTDVS
jgi:hypothetical protein